MIKFSWKKINDKLDWDIRDVVNYFSATLHKSEPFPLPSGDCYILNIDGLFYKSKYYQVQEKYIYLELASRRNLFDYNVRGIKHLHIAFIEDYHLYYIHDSDLFKLSENNIHFKYEQE